MARSSTNFNRRSLLQGGCIAVGGFAFNHWLGRLGRCAAVDPDVGPRRKHCILLWMDGGPSHLDTFDPKPEAAADIRGPFDAIDTDVPGIQIGERFPKLARQVKRLALVRGMCTDEADHGRARTCMHTGYKPGQGGLTYPGLGSIVSHELGGDDSPLPNFVTTGRPLGKYDFISDPGYLGARHAALVHYDPDRTLDNLQPAATADFDRRRAALAAMEDEFATRYRSAAAEGHRAVWQRSVRLMQTAATQAFDLSREPAASAAAYGDHAFGRGCLLARRLVEAGVPLVEVYAENWDTHEKPVYDAAAALMPVVDHAMAALLDDLADRGLLDDVLVVWMGEFGRTPRMNRNGGRDHYAKAWSTVLAGGGIRGGQTVGRTDSMGATVADRPVSARDFMATVCRTLGIDYTRELNTPIGRPITLVEKGAKPIEELFA